MSRDNNGDAIVELVRQIKRIASDLIEKAHFDKTYTGIISSVNSDGYTVKYNGTEINIKTTATDVFKKGDCVKFCVPCGNKRNSYLITTIENIVFNSSTSSSDTINDVIGTILWENDNSTVNFEAQSITLNENINNYKYYEIEYLYRTEARNALTTGKIPVGCLAHMFYYLNTARRREISSISDTIVTFSDCVLCGDGDTTANGYIIPMRIYGYKNK